MDMLNHVDLATLQDAIWGHFHAHFNFWLVVIFMRYTQHHSYRGGLRSVLQAAPTDRLQETGGLSLIIDQKESIGSIVAVHRLLHGHAAITHHVGCKIQSLHIQVEKFIADCLTPGSNFPAWPKEQPIDDLDVGGDLEDDWGVEDDEES